MSKQSSLDFLEIQFEKYLNWKSNPIFDKNCFDEIELMKSFKQAKAMHKQELGKTWDDSIENFKARGENIVRAYVDFDDYYKQRFEQ